MRGLLRRIQSDEMGTGGVLPTLITLGLPAMTAGVMQTLFEVVDTLFVSRLGKEQISGVSLVGPVVFCCYAVASAVNVGVAALLSRRLGEGRLGAARDVLNHGLLISLVVGAALTVGLVLSLDPLLVLMGGDSGILRYAREYASIVFFGVIVMHVATAADGALRAQGDTMTPMQISIGANILNAILNGILIFGLGMGVRGSALGTLITRTGMAALLLMRLRSRRCEVRPGRIEGLPLFVRWRVIGDIYWVGIPASVGLLSMASSMVFINRLLVSLNPFAVGVLGIAWRVESLASVPVFGLFSAVIPMIGYNLGARLHDRCKQTIWTAAWLAAAVMGTGALVVFLFPAFFFGLFTKDPEMLPLGVEYLRIMMPVYPLIGASIMMSAGFQGLGRSWIAMLLHIWRNYVLKLPFAYWFAAVWGLTGVWWSFPASTLASVGIGIGWMYLVLRGMGADDGQVEAAAEAASEESEGGEGP